jgi:hypothetical protein
VGCVTTEALHLVARSRARRIPERRAGEVTGIGVPSRIRRISVTADGHIQRVMARITESVAGPTQVGAGWEEEEEPVAWRVRVVAHIAVLAQLAALDRVLAPRIIENVNPPLSDGTVVTAIAESADGRGEAGWPGSAGSSCPEGLGVGILRDVALLAGRGAVSAQVVNTTDDLALLAGGGENVGKGAGGSDYQCQKGFLHAGTSRGHRTSAPWRRRLWEDLWPDGK